MSDAEVRLERISDAPPSGEALDYDVRNARIRMRRVDHHWVVCRLWSVFLAPFVVQLERRAVEAVGRAAITSTLPERRNRVFLSSTSADLLEHRRAVMHQIVRLDLRFRGMEHFGADPERQYPAAKCREAVRQSDVDSRSRQREPEEARPAARRPQIALHRSSSSIPSTRSRSRCTRVSPGWSSGGCPPRAGPARH